MATKQTAVAKVKQPTGAILVQDSAPDYIKQGSSRGSENVSVADLVIPRLEIIQGLSPALKRSDPKFIEGAEIGDLANSVTRELYGQSLYVVPVHFTKQWLVWRDKKQGGGFGGAYDTEADANAAARERGGAAQGWEAMDTPQHLCLTASGDEIMIPMAKTKAKVSRQWNSMIRLAGGDRFARVYKLSAAEEKNDKGDFYNYTVGVVGFPSKELYSKAEELYQRIAAGEKKVVMHVDDDDTVEHSEM